MCTVFLNTVEYLPKSYKYVKENDHNYQFILLALIPFELLYTSAAF